MGLPAAAPYLVQGFLQVILPHHESFLGKYLIRYRIYLNRYNFPFTTSLSLLLAQAEPEHPWFPSCKSSRDGQRPRILTFPFNGTLGIEPVYFLHGESRCRTRIIMVSSCSIFLFSKRVYDGLATDTVFQLVQIAT